MIVKMLCAAALVAAPVTASAPQLASDYRVFVDMPGVYRVDCAEGRGSAFRVGKRHFLSVAHVTAMHECNIQGHPITLTEQNGEQDFSQFDADVPGNDIIKIDCSGIRVGEWVWASGYAHGLPYQTALAVYATYLKDDSGKRVLIGPFAYIPGMSGAPAMNARGEAVGLVNAYIRGSEETGMGISFSRDLSETSVCQQSGV